MSNPTLSGLAAWTAEADPKVSAYLQLAALSGRVVSDLGARIYFHYGKGGGRYTVIRNTGITVDTILTMIRFRIPAEVMLRAEPKLEWDDLAACCWWAANTDYTEERRLTMSNPRKGVCDGNTYTDVTWHSHGGVKRFVVFGYERYYPSGGFGDGRADFDTKEEAEAHADTLQESCVFDYVEVVDLLETPPWRLSKGKDV